MRWVALGLTIAALMPATASADGLGRIDAVFRPATKDLITYVQGPDGNMWAYGTRKPSIARVTPAGVETTFTAGMPAEAEIRGIAAGPDGNVWFSYITEHETFSSNTVTGSGLGRVTPDGTITTFDLPKPDAYSFIYPNELTAAGDGHLWVVFGYEDPGAFEPDTSVTGLARVDVATQKFTLFPLPNGDVTPERIERDGDDALWFTAGGTGGEMVGRATLDGKSTLFPVPDQDLATDLATGADGNAWIVSSGRPGHLIRVTPAGVFTLFKDTAIADVDEQAPVIGPGPDGNLWVAIRDGVDVFSTAGKRLHRLKYGFTFHGDTEPPRNLAPGPGGMWVTVPVKGGEDYESAYDGVERFAAGAEPALRISCHIERKRRLSHCRATRTTSAAAGLAGRVLDVSLFHHGFAGYGAAAERRHRVRAFVVLEPGVRTTTGTYRFETSGLPYRSSKVTLKISS